MVTDGVVVVVVVVNSKFHQLYHMFSKVKL